MTASIAEYYSYSVARGTDKTGIDIPVIENRMIDMRYTNGCNHALTYFVNVPNGISLHD